MDSAPWKLALNCHTIPASTDIPILLLVCHAHSHVTKLCGCIWYHHHRWVSYEQHSQVKSLSTRQYSDHNSTKFTSNKSPLYPLDGMPCKLSNVSGYGSRKTTTPTKTMLCHASHGYLYASNCTGTGFSPKNVTFPRQYHFTGAPYSYFIHLPLMLYNLSN